MPLPAALLSQTDSDKQSEVLQSNVEGGKKRVGGQGDILSGSTGVLLAWGSEWVKGSYE
jgi:ATP-dependent NAD(P)H-hydrate dehydratase